MLYTCMYNEACLKKHSLQQLSKMQTSSFIHVSHITDTKKLYQTLFNGLHWTNTRLPLPQVCAAGYDDQTVYYHYHILSKLPDSKK